MGLSNFNEYCFPIESYKNYISHLAPRIQGYEFCDSTEQRAGKRCDMKLSYYSPAFQNFSLVHIAASRPINLPFHTCLCWQVTLTHTQSNNIDSSPVLFNAVPMQLFILHPSFITIALHTAVRFVL